MGYILPAAYTFISLYHERFAIPKTPINARIEEVNRIHAYESREQSQQHAMRKFSSHSGRFVDVKV